MKPIKTKSGLLLAKGYKRIVHGGRGDYIEIDKTKIIETNIHIPIHEKWRREYPMAYYIEFRSNDENSVKIYYQLRTVSYADYKLNHYYVAIEDCVINGIGMDAFI